MKIQSIPRNWKKYLIGISKVFIIGKNKLFNTIVGTYSGLDSYNMKSNTMESLYQEVAREILGLPGKMIGASKSGYKEMYPDHIVVFNSNVFMGKSKLWFGDIDITDSINDLKELALSVGEKIYVLFEMDGRFGNENNPQIQNAVATIHPEGEVKFRGYIQDLLNEGKLVI